MKLAGVFASLLVLAGCKKDEAKSGPPSAPAVDAPAARAAPPPDAAPPAKPAETFELGDVMPDTWFGRDGGCARVLARIGACSEHEAFLSALVVDLDDEDRELQLESAARASRWEQSAAAACEQLPSVTYEEEGFLGGRWDELAGDDVLADCGKLGTAVNQAGGLPAGSTDS